MAIVFYIGVSFCALGNELPVMAVRLKHSDIMPFTVHIVRIGADRFSARLQLIIQLVYWDIAQRFYTVRIAVDNTVTA